MTTEPLAHRADRLSRVSRALTRHRPSYRAVFQKTEAATLGVAERIIEQAREAPELLAELISRPFPERRGLVAADGRMRSASLAALVLDEAREQTERAEELAWTAHLILDWVDFEEARPMRVSAYALMAESARRRGDMPAAEAALTAASAQLQDWSVCRERAEYCRAVAHLRWDQGRLDEAVALAERAGLLFEALDEEVEAAEILIELGSWCLQLDSLHEAVCAYSGALCQEVTVSQVLNAAKGLASALGLLGEAHEALAVLGLIRRERLPGQSYEAFVLLALEGQLLLQSGEVQVARKALNQAFHGLLLLGRITESFDTGLALLLAGADGAGELAAQLAPLAPGVRPELRAALEATAAEGSLAPELREVLIQYLFSIGNVDLGVRGEAS